MTEQLKKDIQYLTAFIHEIDDRRAHQAYLRIIAELFTPEATYLAAKPEHHNNN